MRRQSLRPRQIDVHARMRIIRSEEDLELDDDSGGGGTSGGSSQPTATFAELIGSVDDKQHATAAAAAHKPKRKKNIPIPVNLTVESYDDAVKDDFVVPTSYVRFQTVPLAHDDEHVDLDLELAELKWLKQHPKYGENGDPRYQLAPATLVKMLDALEKASALINPSVITPAEAEDVLARQLGLVKTPLNRVTLDVYNYWVTKRQALKRPLLRKFWPQTPLNDTNPHLVFRPREKERYKLRKHRKNDMDGFRKLQQLRADCDRVRQLLALVKRRETAKRLGVDFLDEIRRQAVHELTARNSSGSGGAAAVAVRVPELPVDGGDRNQSRQQLKAKTKKKKKLRLDDAGSDDRRAAESAAGGDATTSAAAAATATAATVKTVAPTAPTRVASFLEYDTSENWSMREDTALQMPAYPSYPVPSSHLMASVFMQPPKYRCRGRVGRGGRLVIDRIPVPPTRYYGPTELRATVGKFTAASATATVSATATTSVAPNDATASSTGSAHPVAAAILIHETSFRPAASKLEAVTSKRLDEIYRMSDSEDELLEPLTSSVYESTRKQAGGSSSISKTPARAAKFVLDI